MSDSRKTISRLLRQAPLPGLRIAKTAAAVLVCLVVYHLRGYRGAAMPTEAMVTAILCMQPQVRVSGEYAASRLMGTALGGVLGLAFLLVMELVPGFSRSAVLLYPAMALGLFFSLFASVLLRRPDTAALSAIVFLAVVVHYPEIEQPIRSALLRVLDTFIGTTAAIAVNVIRLPRRRNPDRVFFVRTRDLVPDRYARIPPSVLFRLGALCEDGARICLISEHAPAFFTIQMNDLRLNLPMIVMDGAALYDVTENRYLYVCRMPQEDAETLSRLLLAQGASHYVYTIHSNATYIFHRGALRECERAVYERMRRTPYRSYLDVPDVRMDEVVYMKVIDSLPDVEALARELRTALPAARYRTVIRPQAGFPGVYALYVYAADASPVRAEQQILGQISGERGPETHEVFLPEGYRTERDALRVLRRVARLYEPLALPFRGRR